MRLRQGRRNGHNLYLQVGDEPSSDDPYIGSVADPAVARILADHDHHDDALMSELFIRTRSLWNPR